METATFPWAVLNPGGRDPDQDFPDLAGLPDPARHAPVNYHGYAACTGGSFLRSVHAVETRNIQNVLLLLRSDLRESLHALRQLKKNGCRVWISFKESGLHQIGQTLQKKDNPAHLRTLCAESDGALSSTPDAVAIYQAAGATQVSFVPTPYPVKDPRWDFSAPTGERSGIFVGTREFDVPSRNHLAAVLTSLHAGKRTGEPVTVINLDGGRGRKQLLALAATVAGAHLEILEGRRTYPDYLRLVARHKIIFQYDASSVPGQVAGDALLCRIPCVGGNGATESRAFAESNSHGRTLPELLTIAEKLILDPAAYSEAVASSQANAMRALSFSSIAARLAAL